MNLGQNNQEKSTYQQTIDWMFNKLPMYQNIGASAYKKDLTNTIALAAELGNPESRLTCIHVAGTNGKGSTSHMLASILQESGYKVGLYTSPHLKDYRERIKINGIDISESYVVEFVKKHIEFFEANDLSFFEMTFGLAIDYFVNKNVDIAIIEVGMGGRLDSTNIITPLISVITNIGFDHMQFLGSTLPLIASEKAGIIKPNVPVVIGEYIPETKSIFIEKAKYCNSDIYFAAELITDVYTSMLLGDYQVHNIKTVMQTIAVLCSQKQFIISEQKLRVGLMHVLQNTNLQGRWQTLGSNPIIICDTAHNAEGLKIVLNQVKNQIFDTLHIVIGVVNDKDLTTILPLFPKNATYYFCKPNIPRGLDQNVLQQKAAQFSLIGNTYNSVSNAYTAARHAANEKDFVFIGGSTFVVAEVL